MVASSRNAVTARRAQEKFPEVLDRTVRGKERVLIRHNKGAVAALIPIEDLEFLEEVEDRLDAIDFRAAMEEWERDGRKTTPLEQVIRELGIKVEP
jgi:prevent-host-death family protein